MTRIVLVVFYLVTFILISNSAAQDNINLPIIGNDTSTRFSADEEKFLGETFMRQVRLELPISDDPEINEYLSGLGFRLIANSNFSNRYFNFFAVNDPSINAFAGPNGYIGINAGLILNTEDESELASVLAHEIAHVTQRHLERRFDTGEKLNLPTAAAIITAIILGSQANINLTEAAIFATIAANYQTQLSYSRAHELEADHIGMQILTKAQFDAKSMPSFFEKLHYSHRLSEAQIPEFLSTHPVTVKRIAESRNRASQYTYQPRDSGSSYFLTKAKLRVVTSSDRKALTKRLLAEIKEGSYQNKAAQIYAYSLALMDIGELSKAREQIKSLIKLDGEKIPYQILQANIEIESGNFDTGLKLFSDALNLNPGNASLSLHFADALLTQKQPFKAKQILRAIKNYQPTPTYYQMMAKAEGDTGNSSASHQMLAEYYLMFDQIPIAINHLRQAKHGGNISAVEKQKIENRIEEIQQIAIMEKEF